MSLHQTMQDLFFHLSHTPESSPADHSSRDDSAGSGALIAPGGRQDTGGLVVSSEAVDTRLDETGIVSLLDNDPK